MNQIFCYKINCPNWTHCIHQGTRPLSAHALPRILELRVPRDNEIILSEAGRDTGCIQVHSGSPGKFLAPDFLPRRGIVLDVSTYLEREGGREGVKREERVREREMLLLQE